MLTRRRRFTLVVFGLAVIIAMLAAQCAAPVTLERVETVARHLSSASPKRLPRWTRLTTAGAHRRL